MIIKISIVLLLLIQNLFATYSNLTDGSSIDLNEFIFLILFLIIGGYLIKFNKKRDKYKYKNLISEKLFWYIPSLMLIVAILPLPIEYYTLLRLIVFISIFYIIYRNYNNGNKKLIFIFVLIGIVFNILSPLYLPKGVWIIIDILVAYLLISNVKEVTKTTDVKNNIEPINIEINKVDDIKVSSLSESEICEIANRYVTESSDIILKHTDIFSIKIFYRSNYLDNPDDIDIYDFNSLIPLEELNDSDYILILKKVRLLLN